MRSKPETDQEGTVDRAATRTPDEGDRPRTHLHRLQQASGNVAIARLLQRAPAERPASTDIADVGGSSAASAHPKKAPGDVHARVIKYDVDNEMGLITIGSGPDQGVEVGMKGSLVRENGTEYEDFTVEKASGRVSSAHVRSIQDRVRADPQVVIKTAGGSPDNQAGKEF